MPTQKKIVTILYGGKSVEHEVSLLSAKNVADAIDKKRYSVRLVKIGKKGVWELRDGGKGLLSGRAAKLLGDVVFPILHGPYGEDGTVQGLLRLAGVPFVGAGVLGSAVGMDKDVMKRLLREADIPIGRYRVCTKNERCDFKTVSSELGLPLFIKPANAGSSVGVSKVKNEGEWARALKEAFRYDTKVLVEEAIVGREIECAILGNEDPKASALGEIKPTHEFYSYEAKYLDENGAELIVPAELPSDVAQRIQQLAIRTFRVLGCEGLGRVDFFVQSDGKIFVNEINTIPGFTKISMYPRLWAASGVSYSKLITKLIDLALARHKKDTKLKTSR